jgi:hypothetical protein
MDKPDRHGFLHAGDPGNLQVSLGNCSELIGTSQIPVARVVNLVPGTFQIAARVVLQRSGARGPVPQSVGGRRTAGRGPGRAGRCRVDSTDGYWRNQQLHAVATNSLRLAARLELSALPVSIDPAAAGSSSSTFHRR